MLKRLYCFGGHSHNFFFLKQNPSSEFGKMQGLEQSRSYTCGGLMQNCVAWGVRVVMNETHLSVFHSALNHARGKRSRNRISSVARYAFNLFFFVSSKRFYDIHVTWFDRFWSMIRWINTAVEWKNMFCVNGPLEGSCLVSSRPLTRLRKKVSFI